jgi:hypothetical protein
LFNEFLGFGCIDDPAMLELDHDWVGFGKMNKDGFFCSFIGGEGGFCCSFIGEEGGFCCSFIGE